MKHSCIRHQPRSRLIILKEDFLKICDTHKGAALLLGLFEYWHNIRLEQVGKSSQQNDVAEKHGEDRVQDEQLFQFHTADQLYDSLLGLVGKDMVSAGIKILTDNGYITTHKNPNPRYKFDSTKHFLLHPDVINSDITKLGNPDTGIRQTEARNPADGGTESGRRRHGIR